MTLAGINNEGVPFQLSPSVRPQTSPQTSLQQKRTKHTIQIQEIPHSPINEMNATDIFTSSSNLSSEYPDSLVEEAVINESNILDVLVIGAGPHALAFLTRLLEPYPSAIMDDREHLRVLRWRKRQNEREGDENDLASKRKKWVKEKVMVVDRHGKWMHQWNSQFATFQIDKLRSPVYFHLDPHDHSGLRAFAEETDRMDELYHLENIFEDKSHRRQDGKKFRTRGTLFNETHRNEYFVPSTKLFHDFNQQLLKRYSLSDSLIIKADVAFITPVNGPGSSTIYQVSLSNGEIAYARSVVSAIGNANLKRVPLWAQDLRVSGYQDKIVHAWEMNQNCIHDIDANSGESTIAQNSSKSLDECKICQFGKFTDNGEIRKSSKNSRRKKLKSRNPEMHAVPKAKSLQNLTPAKRPSMYLPIEISADIEAKLQSPNHRPKLLIVGGGLTAAQLARVAVSRGFEEIQMITRSHFKTKQFDVDLTWVGRYRGVCFQKFWEETEKFERVKMIRRARNGGSITPEMMSVLKQYINNGILRMQNQCEVTNCIRCEDTNKFKVTYSNGETDYVDLIWLATGSFLDARQEPIFKNFMDEFDVSTVEGFPDVTEDLRLHPDHNVFVLGGYASLQLGPNAINLIGSRAGSERVVSVLEGLLDLGFESDVTDEIPDSGIGSEDGDDVDIQKKEIWKGQKAIEVISNAGNWFEVLDGLGDEED